MDNQRKAEIRKALEKYSADGYAGSPVMFLAEFALAKLDQCNKCHGTGMLYLTRNEDIKCPLCQPELDRLYAALIGKE